MQVSSTADAEPASSSDHGATLSADQPTASPSKGIQFNPVKQDKSSMAGISHIMLTDVMMTGYQCSRHVYPAFPDVLCGASLTA